MNRRKLLIGVLSGAGILAVAIGLMIFGFSGEKGNDKFPGELLGLPFVQYVEGEEAIASIGQLHGTDVGTKEGYIASYQDQAKGQSITIWISVDPVAKAQELFKVMDSKITNNPNTPFKGRTELEVNGLKVIKVTGMGQDHYYWVEGEENIWVALGGFENSQDSLNNVIKTLK